MYKNCIVWESTGMEIVRCRICSVWVGCDEGSSSVGALRCGGIAVWRSCGIGELPCGGVVVLGSCLGIWAFGYYCYVSVMAK